MLMTRRQAEKWLDNSEGRQYNADGYYGFQCYDYSKMFFYVVTGEWIGGLKASNIPFDNKAKIEKYATIIKNYDSFLPQKGDIVCFPDKYGGGYGHTAVVTRATLTQFEVLEQNWFGNGWTDGVVKPGWGPETVSRRWHYYDNPMYFIRFNFPKNVSVTKKAKRKLTSKKASGQIKRKKIMIVAGHGYNDPGAVGNGTNERDFIRKNLTPKIADYLRKTGHEVALYGGSKQSQDMYQDTAYGVRVGNKRDYGMYWVNKQNYDLIVEFHLDAAGPSASGGHVIISSAFSPDEIDKDLQEVIKNNLGQIRGITKRSDLLHANVSAEINMNYRLAELGFITNKEDMDWIKKNSNKYAKLIAGAIHGSPIGGVVASKKKSSSKKLNVPKTIPSGYKLNNKGIPYKKEKGRYTVTTIKGNNVRTTYSDKAEITGTLPNGEEIIYDGAFAVNGYRWITYLNDDLKRRYIATGEIDKNGKRTSSYGKFSRV